MNIPERIIPYDPHFLGGGIVVPLPVPRDNLLPELLTHDDGHVIDYTHFSLAIHKGRHTAVYSACNIDGRRRVMGVSRKGTKWMLDERAGDSQLGNEAYANAAWDRGHLTRREDVIWGDPTEARQANRATFFYTNAAPQHENFNQDEWLFLEEWVLDWADEDLYRLCVITGPVLKENDRRLSEGDPELRRVILPPEEIQIPAAYWKIVALRDRETNELGVAAFAMRQTDMWDDKEGRTLLRLTVHQVSVEAIEEWTDLSFGPLREADAIQVRRTIDRFARSAEGDLVWPVIQTVEDIIAPVGAAPRDESTAAFSRSISKSGCGCEGGETDVQSAIASLSEDVARLTDTVTRLATTTANVNADDFATHSGGEGGDSRDVETRGGVPGVAPLEDERLPDEQLSDEERVARVLETIQMRSSSDRTLGISDLTRIVGGVDVGEGEYPSTCCLGSFDRFFCTGVLIHPRVVVTAAHCGANIVFAYFGNLIPTKGGSGKTMRVKSAVVHPRYAPKQFVRNDISVLILNDPAPFAPVRIASSAEMAQVQSVQLVGFGFNDPMKPLGFGQKRKVTVPVGAVRRNQNENLAALESRFGFSSNHEFVAGRKLLGRDSCNGDSGGPAFILGDSLSVAGVTSRATREATKNCGDGGIYVRLDVYRPWIAQVAAAAGITL